MKARFYLRDLFWLTLAVACYFAGYGQFPVRRELPTMPLDEAVHISSFLQHIWIYNTDHPIDADHDPRVLL
jgi:hypothetical protein